VAANPDPIRSRLADPRFVVAAAIVVAALMLALCGISAVVSYRIQSARAQPSATLDPFVCAEPAMTLLTGATPAPGQPTYTPPPGAVGPPMTTTVTAGVGPEVPLPTAPPGRPIQSLAFLELPFPYDGGNESFGGTDQQFRQASQRTGQGGRINSFFDHLYPLYPAPQDPTIKFGREPAQPPIGGAILIFDGTLSDFDNYSGHPAYDYAPFVRRQPTTPLFAAADGVIHSVGEHSSGALYVKIVHTVPGIGNFQTIYWHLHPDEFFTAMLGTEGRPITAGTRLGTMGNTGWSTGHHLHFEVRYDRNADGGFSGDEAVDPYGFVPNGLYPSDPWAQAASFTDGQGQPYNHFPSYSDYLWIHPLGVSAAPQPDGGGQVNTAGDTGGAGGDGASAGRLCAGTGTFSPDSVVNWSWAPDPPPTGELAGVGQACVLSAFDAQGGPIGRFDPPVAITLPLDPAAAAHVEAGTLAIYWMAAGDSAWQALPTQLDATRRLALAYAHEPGRCALLGRPARDLVPPESTISVDGLSAPDGSLYDVVTVSIDSRDPGGVERIDYSLDAGDTWQPYTGPFELRPSGLPEPIGDDAALTGEGLGSGPGRYLILASAVDRAGNVEDPPASFRINIDPSKAPAAAPTNTPPATETATTSATPSQTPTPTTTGTPTPTPTRTRPPATRTPTPTPTPFRLNFRADAYELQLGQCTTLRWDVDGVRDVHLYGGQFGPEPGVGVGGHDTRQVCRPGALVGGQPGPVMYTLQVTRLDGSIFEEALTIVHLPLATVTGSPPP
jgi:murein DD-endopeptidase MepM/ murein hydrolase activator NlpD